MLYVFRLHLRPLLKDVPFVGGVTVCFLQAPEIDFDLGGVANTLDLPGVSLLLRHVIRDQLEQTVVMPNSLSVSLVPDDDGKAEDLRLEATARAPPPPSGVLRSCVCVFCVTPLLLYYTVVLVFSYAALGSTL